MEVLILHLSDLHIANKDAINQEHIAKLVQSLRVMGNFDGVILAVSGDIAAHGFTNEYKHARKFLGSIMSNIKDTYGCASSNCYILVVPGNHDINQNVQGAHTRDEIESLVKSNLLEEQIPTELKRMNSFLRFSKDEMRFLPSYDPLYNHAKMVFKKGDVDTCTVSATLYNSALFSCKDDNGIHYAPKILFKDSPKEYCADLSIAIMHHSPDWFFPVFKGRLNDKIKAEHDLVLYGHEHYNASESVDRNGTGPAIIQEGGVWWKDGFQKSSYFSGVFNTKTHEYRQRTFTWETTASVPKGLYSHGELFISTLPIKNSATTILSPRKEYIQNLLQDDGQSLRIPFTDYYVFPSLHQEEAGGYDLKSRIESEAELVSMILKTPQLMLSGENKAGKTMLLKQLFLHLSKKYTVLLCGVNDISGKLQKNIIRNVFSEIYGDDPLHYTLFEQQDINSKIILIDDSNLIVETHLAKLLTGLKEQFGHIVIASQKDMVFDVRERACNYLGINQSISSLSISSFYADKRRKLIRNLVGRLKSDDILTLDSIVSKIDDALSLQNLSFKLDPDFIVKFTSYYCSHFIELQTGDKAVFSKVFEASIEVAIQPYLRNETVGLIMTVLSEVAYYIHFNKIYPISENDIEETVNTYVEKYESDIKFSRFLEITTSAKLLIKSHQDWRYRFRNNDYLAYFVSLALSRHFNEDEDSARKALLEVVRNSCFSINPTILKYLAYSTQNMRIVALLLEQVQAFVESWDIYDISKNQFKYLSDVQFHGPQLIAQNARDDAIMAKAHSEESLEMGLKKLEHNGIEAIQTIDLYDYDESAIWDLNNQLTKALLQMNVVASTLPLFSHILVAPLKQRLVSALYEIPNKIFHRWAQDVEDNFEKYISEIFTNVDEPKTKAEKYARAKTGLQKVSLDLLLNLFYSVARNAASVSTIQSLIKECNLENPNQYIELLMFYEEIDDWRTLIKKTDELDKNTSDIVVKALIRYIVQHIITWSSGLPFDQRHFLMDRFGFKKDVKGYLLQKNR